MGVPFIDLTESNPTHCGFEFLTPEILRPLAASDGLRYRPDPRGALKAREAVSRYYDSKKINISPDHIVLTASTSEAYSFVFKLLIDPSGRAAIPAPSYPLLDSLLTLGDASRSDYRLFYDKRWRIDLHSLEESLRRGCGALCIINPNNPTGNFIPMGEAHALNRLALKYGAALVSDEVFLDYKLDPEASPASFADNKDCLTFTLSGISKILGLPQMKLSWIVVSGPEDIRREALRRLEIIADTFLSVNAPAQEALGGWLERGPAARREISHRTAVNHDLLKKSFSGRTNLEVLNAEGGWAAVMRAEFGMDDEELALHLLRTAKVLTHPGYLYDFERGEYLVLSLLPHPEKFREGIQRIEKALA